MRLPNADRVEISPEKVRDYLLSDRHPVGRFKARFFRSLGYSAENWDQLAADLHRVSQSQEARQVESPYGQKFSIVALIAGPNGRSASVVTIWIVGSGSSIPKFVTAYPAE